MRYFTVEEFNCQHTGENRMEAEFMELVDELRHQCGFPFVITSGYRSPQHPIEAKKDRPGTHAQGIAADIKVINAADRFSLVSKALDLGFTGIGVEDGFVHVDTRGSTPVMWLY